MSRLILMRHGQSIWNQKNLFTGWVDVPLSEQGIQESLAAGVLIQKEPIDTIFTSTLIRASMTAMIAMSVHTSGKTPFFLHQKEVKEEWYHQCSSSEKSKMIPVIPVWELNERMYGKLQGMNKQEMKNQYGEEQVQRWRRSFDIAPPDGESLEMTAARTLPFFEQQILPLLQQGKNILVVAHGNSLRSILMKIHHLSPQEVVQLEVETGKPLFYDF